MNKNEALFMVKYIGNSSSHFTKNKTYQVLEVDEDGDYILLDNFFNKISHYKSKFIVVNQYSCCECSDISEYKLSDIYYCEECLLKRFDVTESTETHYSPNGEYLGSDEDIGRVMGLLD